MRRDDGTPIRRTKLVCTIGPASVGRIDELVAAGMDVARINLSHGSPASHLAAAAAVRRAEAAAGRPIAILVDLAGPKIRLGPLVDDLADLTAGSTFVLASAPRSDAGDAAGAHVTDPDLAAEVQVGDPIFLADGAVELRVTAIDDDVRTEVVRGGTIRSRAGVVIPADRSHAPPLTAKDRADLTRVAELGADYVGQSFVRAASDIEALRDVVGPDGPRVVAKIETRPAVEAFEAILEVTDAVMIARGDLGVEVPYEHVPLIQKQLVGRALERGVPTIVATQMLESMTVAPRPTRAEASDVANAVFDGADAVMLSGETAIGANPIESARAAVRIVTRAESDGAAYLPVITPRPSATDRAAVVAAAVTLASAHDDIAAICCATRTGRTALALAALRPRVPIIALSADPGVVARLTLVSGVVPRLASSFGAADQIGGVGRWLADAGLLGHGASVVIVASGDGAAAGSQLLGIQRVGTLTPGPAGER